mmetsp:Transcript_12615/g.16987  ORF Transcript_12615/g.16987 Transcript_12615/m.16987 type:complete len:366 (-) Transcript_12615:561-1658(-)
MSDFYASLLQQIQTSDSLRDWRRRRIHLQTMYLSSRTLLASTSSEDELWAQAAALAKSKMLRSDTLSDYSSSDEESSSSSSNCDTTSIGISLSRNDEDPRRHQNSIKKASTLSLHLCAKAMLSHESYLRDAIADSGLRWNIDYCLAQNLYRFKAKLLLGCKDLFFRWNSWDSMARKTNSYWLEFEEGLTAIKRAVPNWRVQPNNELEMNAEGIRYYYHDGEYAPYAAVVVASIEKLRRILDRKYPVHFQYRDISSNNLEWNGAPMSRSVFRQRDRVIFALFHDYLVQPIKVDGNVIPLPELEFQYKIRQLAKRSEGHPCLVYAAQQILLESRDVASSCVVPRNLPGMWQGCCAEERVPWFSHLEV